jgi:type VI secretion system protein ImpL
MKLIKTSHKFKALFHTKIPNSDIFLRALAQLGIIAILSVAIWFWGPLIGWKELTPLATSEKRLYAILYLFLIWLLKILLVDFSLANSTFHRDPDTRKKLQALQNRFRGVGQFLKKTSVNKQGSSTSLNQLPWYLLIGSANAGKTTLLANSKVPFILKRQYHAQQIQNLSPSENCDWWVTRDVSIIDVPSAYLSLSSNEKSPEKSGMYAAVWQFFLRRIKKQRGKNAIKGILIALPLPEIMKQGNPKKYHHQLQHLFMRIQEIQKTFALPIPAYLIITKCDLIPGFAEFFAESTDDEVNQAWGLMLPATHSGDKIVDLFTDQFNNLIKKINQQLLWRLHQERNPMARPYIKDFPLQIERLKTSILDFIKRLSHSLSIPLQAVYLTSSIQVIPEPDENIIESANTTQRSIQIFKQPAAASRAYFTKQLISQGLILHKEHPVPIKTSPLWKRRSAYAFSFIIIALAAVMLGNDFEQSIKQSYAIHNTLSEYQLAIQVTQNPDEQLGKTLTLLNSLQQTAKNPNFKLDILHLLTFYSNKSEQKSHVVYQQVLENILIPELSNYLGEYLKTPVNKNTDLVYAALEAYLMFGDPAHYQADFIHNTLETILPNSMTSSDITQLMTHVKLALHSRPHPLTLNTNLIQETRKYLVALPSFQLSYVILKNINNNNLGNTINLGTNTKNLAFVNQSVSNQVPQMFTAKAFANIFSQETIIAAQESTSGNWILGNTLDAYNTNADMTSLLQQLRDAYINNYVETWESLLGDIHLTKPKDLTETDAIISNLIGNDSPLLQLLQTLHDNTYFEPITAFSPKLQNLGLLLDKTNSSNLLYQIFSGLQSLHQYLHAILIAENEQKAAFEAVSTRMHHAGGPDIITQLRLTAEKSPEPVKTWLNKITNNSWRFLLQDATHYMDITWQKQIGHFYQMEIANHYPFSQNATQEVELNKFTDFFGNPGLILSFYNQYLLPFVDTTTTDWRWKTLDNQKLPFSDNSLHQLQTALRIHHIFFPNSDNKLHVQFALQPYLLSKEIKQVKLRINDKKIIDQHPGPYHSHLLSWPSNHETKMTSVQLTMLDQKIMNRDFPGAWGWFKLVNQSFISAFSTKKILLNLSENSYPVKYFLYTQGQVNPFLSLNLVNFHLPQQLIGVDKSHA